MRLSEAAEREIAHLEAMLARLEAGEEDPEDFRIYRLKNAFVCYLTPTPGM